LGIGINLGLIVWLMALFSWRRVLVWLGLICAATLVLAYAVEQPLYFAHEEASHTHAFDEWASPFPSGSTVDWQMVRDKLLQKIEVLEPMALGGLALLMLLGLVLLKFDPLTLPTGPAEEGEGRVRFPSPPSAGGEGRVRGRVEAFLVKQPPTSNGPVPVWNRSVPGPILGLLALLGLVIFSVAALYIYYPAPKEAFEEIVRVRADASVAVLSGHKEEAIRQIQQWDLLTRKLQVGVFIRTGRMDPKVTQVTEDLRERLEDLRDALLANNLTEAKEMLPKVEEAYRRCRAAYDTNSNKARLG
jgi:hypothetical protein